MRSSAWLFKEAVRAWGGFEGQSWREFQEERTINEANLQGLWVVWTWREEMVPLAFKTCSHTNTLMHAHTHTHTHTQTMVE